MCKKFVKLICISVSAPLSFCLLATKANCWVGLSNLVYSLAAQPFLNLIDYLSYYDLCIAALRNLKQIKNSHFISFHFFLIWLQSRILFDWCLFLYISIYIIIFIYVVFKIYKYIYFIICLLKMLQNVSFSPKKKYLTTRSPQNSQNTAFNPGSLHAKQWL